MKKLIIDASRFTSKAEMFNCLHEVLGYENFYGNNLDSLHDRLTMIFEPTEITVKNFSSAILHLDMYANIFWHLLDDCTEENKNLTVKFD